MSPVAGRVISRRALLIAPAVALACGRPRATAFPGYVFVANAGGHSLTVVDLTAFAVKRHIPLESPPTAVIADSRRAMVYVLTPENGTVIEIDGASLAVRRKLRLGASAISMLLAPDAGSMWVLLKEPRLLTQVTLDDFRVTARIRLPAEPEDFDLNRAAPLAAVSFPGAHSIGVTPLDRGSLERLIDLGGDSRLVRFRSDGRQLITADRAGRRVSILDTASSKLIVHLPLPLEPTNFCFKSDGGQLFVTGKGMDAVVVIHPYQTEISETVLAGKAPGAMAVSTAPEYLFIANPESDDVTVLEIESRRLVAVVAVGSEPGFIAITPDSQYALVLNQRSGDMAVIRVAAVSQRQRSKIAPLFTMIPVGAKPVSAAVQVS
jgi:YVTN family beta-propeller protein